jgi:hypothetical protein
MRTKFKAGQIVKLNRDLTPDELSDYETDLQDAYYNHEITQKQLDTIYAALYKRSPLKIVALNQLGSEPHYDCKLNRTYLPFALPEKLLEPV